ncbi:hypothetical protein PV10_04015 [Exophiala mesophila]|uniref:Uncharacterized protein n=1 Tax=Exophiala mesophila TaxID=212818 RepID=A0A0D1ZFV0_EXOME|nr:uncharacterized protein PV10_04015 [Exophiala mesophila]KIV92744.1 hypothetical protein PV10_04015 [Exophiala mesophila]
MQCPDSYLLVFDVGIYIPRNPIPVLSPPASCLLHPQMLFPEMGQVGWSVAPSLLTSTLPSPLPSPTKNSSRQSFVFASTIDLSSTSPSHDNWRASWWVSRGSWDRQLLVYHRGVPKRPWFHAPSLI